jgi:hypothetical protein
MAEQPNHGIQDYRKLAEDSLHSFFSAEVTLRHQLDKKQSRSKLEYYQRTALVDPRLPKTPY